MASWWLKVKVRKRRLADVHRFLELQRVRMLACQLELTKIQDLRKKSYLIMWSKMLEHYNHTLEVQKSMVGCDNLFWILTGKRWVPITWIRGLFK